MKKILVLALVAVSLGGCASYRTSSGIDLSKPDAKTVLSEVEILKTSLPKDSYKSLGIVNAVVKKLTIFHEDPTEEQVNIALAEKARKKGANAVINVTYKKGVGLTTWGYIKATGEAVEK